MNKVNEFNAIKEGFSEEVDPDLLGWKEGFPGDWSKKSSQAVKTR